MQQRIGPEIKALSNLIIRNFIRQRPLCGETEVTRMQGWVVGYLSRQEEAGREVYQRDLEREFHIRRSTVSGILTLMEKNGLLRRTTSALDGRMKRLELTDSARALHRQVQKELDAMEEQMRQGISEADLAAFFRVAEQIQANLSVLEAQTAGSLQEGREEGYDKTAE